MTDQYILTPFYLDQPVPELTAVGSADWIYNTNAPEGHSTQQRMISLYKPLAQTVSDTLQNGKRPISIAGDCCSTIGVLAGLQQAGVQPTLIWFDAHGDFNDWETTPSGFLGGMPLAMMVGRGDQTMVTGVGLQQLPEQQVILTDARDLDPGEAAALSDSAVDHRSEVADLLTMPLPDGPLYVHFDTDILDPSDAPAMNYPTPNGPSLGEMNQVFSRLSATGRVTAVSVSTWNPHLDEDGRSQMVIMSLLETLLSKP